MQRAIRRLHRWFYKASSWAVRGPEMRVTFGLVNFRSPCRLRLERDLLPTIAHYPQGKFEILCLDNSPEPSSDLAELFPQLSVPSQYHWNGGQNTQVAAAKNWLYARASHPIMVYVCAAHGRMFDPSWLADIIRPLRDPRVALAGHCKRYRRADGTFVDFIQGGIMAVNVPILRRHPLSPDFPHNSSDVAICEQLQDAGYKVADVPTILSFWKSPLPARHRSKYVHANE